MNPTPLNFPLATALGFAGVPCWVREEKISSFLALMNRFRVDSDNVVFKNVNLHLISFAKETAFFMVGEGGSSPAYTTCESIAALKERSKRVQQKEVNPEKACFFLFLMVEWNQGQWLTLLN